MYGMVLRFFWGVQDCGSVYRIVALSEGGLANFAHGSSSFSSGPFLSAVPHPLDHPKMVQP